MPSKPERGTCSECQEDRLITHGICRSCRTVCLDVEDGESPGRLDESGWVKVGITWQHRDAFGRAS